MESTPNEMVTLNACILRVCCCDLLCCDLCTSQQVLVHTQDACCFRVGEHVCIEYNGVMTNSLPPQITDTCIRRMYCCC